MLVDCFGVIRKIRATAGRPYGFVQILTFCAGINVLCRYQRFVQISTFCAGINVLCRYQRFVQVLTFFDVGANCVRPHYQQ